MADPRSLTPEELAEFLGPVPAVPRALTPEELAALTAPKPERQRTIGQHVKESLAPVGEFVGRNVDKANKALARAGIGVPGTAGDFLTFGPLARDFEASVHDIAETIGKPVSTAVGRAAMRLGQVMDTEGADAYLSQSPEDRRGVAAGIDADVEGNRKVGAALLTLPLGGGPAGALKAGLGASLLDPDVSPTVAAASAMGLRGLSSIAKASQPALRRTGDYLKQAGIQQGRKALLPGATLRESTQLGLRPDVVEEALQSRAIQPLGTPAGAHKRLQRLADAQSDEYARVVGELKGSGVTGPEARGLVRDISSKGKELERNTLNPALPEEYFGAAERLERAAGIAPPPMAHGGHGRPPAPPPSLVDPFGRPLPAAPPQPKARVYLDLEQAENLKRSMQDLARYGKIEDTPLNNARKDLASLLRQANEDAIAAQAFKAPEAASRFVSTKQRLGRLLGAEEAAKRGAANQSRSSPMPNAIDVGIATATGNAAALAGGPIRQFFRNRAPSTAATGLYGAGRGLQALAQPSLAAPMTAATTRAAVIAELLSGKSPALAPALADREMDPETQAILDRLLGR